MEELQILLTIDVSIQEENEVQSDIHSQLHTTHLASTSADSRAGVSNMNFERLSSGSYGGYGSVAVKNDSIAEKDIVKKIRYRIYWTAY